MRRQCRQEAVEASVLELPGKRGVPYGIVVGPASRRRRIRQSGYTKSRFRQRPDLPLIDLTIIHLCPEKFH
jgi:hypothetical protein